MKFHTKKLLICAPFSSGEDAQGGQFKLFFAVSQFQKCKFLKKLEIRLGFSRLAVCL